MGKAIIYYIILLAVILGVTSMIIKTESCSPKKSLTTIHANDLSADKADAEPADDLEEDDDEPMDEHNDATGSTSSDEDADDDEVKAIEGDEPEYSDDDAGSVEDAAAAEEEEEERRASTSSSRNGGAYLVIAGAFSKEENANSEVNRLRDNGYPNAEIVEFDFSDFYSVCVARYNTRSDAQAVANSIVSKSGKKAYVHKKRNKK